MSDISAGFKHTVIKLKNGDFYGFGSNKFSQLDGQQGKLTVPQNCDKVAVSWHNTVWYSSSASSAVVWGDNKFGQKCETGVVDFPSEIEWIQA